MKILNSLKILTKLLKEKIKISIGNIYAVIYFGMNNSVLNKPLIVKGVKFISFHGHIHIYNGLRLEFFVQKEELPHLFFGNNVLIGYNCSFLISKTLEIGDNVMIASNVLITTENHGIDLSSGNYNKQRLKSGNVKIGNNVWIGEKCVILPNVIIGDNVVVGASSVVTKNIPPNSIVCGSPAKIIKKYDFVNKKWVEVK